MSLSHRVALVLYMVFVCLMAFRAYRTPLYNWDMLPYIACAGRLSHGDVYRLVKAQVPPATYRDLATGSDYRADLSANAEHFAQQLAFYRIRPLYLASIFALRGIGYVRAAVLVSVLSYIVIAMLVFAWLFRYVGAWAAPIAALIVVSPPIFLLAYLQTPDAFSSALVLLGLVLLFEQRRPALALLVLLASIAARTDNLLLFVALVIWLAWTRQISRAHASFAAAASFALYLAVNYFAHNYGWRVLIYHTLVARAVAPAQLAPAFTAYDYLRWLSNAARTLAFRSYAPVFLLLSATAFMAGTLRRYQHMIVLISAATALRLLAFPTFEERHYALAYLVMAPASVILIAARAPLPLPHTGWYRAVFVPDFSNASRPSPAGQPLPSPQPEPVAVGVADREG